MTVLSAILYTAIQGAQLGAVVGVAVLPSQMKRAITAMRLKEKLSSIHAPEKIIWTAEDPFKNEAEEKVEGLSLAAAKQWLMGLFRAGEGTPCPCCGQTVRRYSRAISGPMVKALAYAAESQSGATSKKMTSIQGGGDYGKLVYWGFLEKKDNGKWYATDTGKSFLRGDIPAAKYVYLFNNTAFGRSEDQVHVWDCAGKEFKFSEIMDVPSEPELESVPA